MPHIPTQTIRSSLAHLIKLDTQKIVLMLIGPLSDHTGYLKERKLFERADMKLYDFAGVEIGHLGEVELHAQLLALRVAQFVVHVERHAGRGDETDQAQVDFE